MLLLGKQPKPCCPGAAGSSPRHQRAGERGGSACPRRGALTTLRPCLQAAERNDSAEGFSHYPSQYCNSINSQWVAVAGLLHSAHVRCMGALSFHPEAWFAPCSHINELFIDFLRTADFCLKHKYFQALKHRYLKIKKESSIGLNTK